MNEKEALNLVGLALANFPNMQEKDMRPTAALWAKMLSDVPYQIAEQALLYVLSTAKFFPTIAEIREAVVKITTPEMPSPMEAWAIGRKIAKKYSPARMMDGDYEKARDETPEVIWRVIQYIGWREFCFYGDDYMRNRFIKSYEIEVRREQERMQLGGLMQLPEPERRLKAIEIAGQLDRTENAINIRASKLGLRKNREWKTSEIIKLQKLRLDNPGITYTQMAKKAAEELNIHVSPENIRWHVENRKIGDSDGSTA